MPTAKKTGQVRGAVTDHERAMIIALRRSGASVYKITTIVSRGKEKVSGVLRDAGLLAEPRVAQPAPQHIAPEWKIILRGFTDEARIDWYRRKFGAERIIVAPAVVGKLYAWDDAHG